MPGNIFVFVARRMGTIGICWRDATKYITMHSTVPMTKNYQAQSAHSAEVGEPCHGRRGGEDGGTQYRELEDCH